MQKQRPSGAVKEKILVLLMLLAGSVLAEHPRVEDTLFVAFDTETTGFSPSKDRLVEIGAVKFRGDGSVLASTNWLINPQRGIPEYAEDVHGITAEMTAHAPLFSEVWPQFEAFCGDSVLMAHNARFDVRFLEAELERAGVNVPAFEVVDTLPLFRRWFPRAPGYSLKELAAWLQVDSNPNHRAEQDSLVIVRLFSEGVKRTDGEVLNADDYLKR